MIVVFAAIMAAVLAIMAIGMLLFYRIGKKHGSIDADRRKTRRLPAMRRKR